MSKFVFTQARIFDGDTAPTGELFDVVVADGFIQEIVGAGSARGEAQIDCDGRLLMPGFIDAHVHVYISNMRVSTLLQRPDTFHAYYAASFLQGCLDRGFTTVRDVAGADVGLAIALQEGLLPGPRLFYGGRALSQTGGHGDGRLPEDGRVSLCSCHAGGVSNLFCTIADGPDAVRLAVREELRRGAHHVKLHASGGVISPSDPLDRSQYSDAEISVAVEECERRGAYVAAHCHPTEAIRRCVALGVRSIEHGTLIDEPTAEFVAKKGAFVVPTMATCFALLADGDKCGLTPVSRAKLEIVAESALHGLEIMHEAKVKTGFGTDLLAQQSGRQSTEFALRARVLPPLAVLRSACAVNAELLGQTGKLGCIKEGAHADLLLVDGDPVKDIAILEQRERMPIVMKAGAFVRRAA